MMTDSPVAAFGEGDTVAGGGTAAYDWQVACRGLPQLAQKPAPGVAGLPQLEQKAEAAGLPQLAQNLSPG